MAFLGEVPEALAAHVMVVGVGTLVLAPPSSDRTIAQCFSAVRCLRTERRLAIEGGKGDHVCVLVRAKEKREGKGKEGGGGRMHPREGSYVLCCP